MAKSRELVARFLSGRYWDKQTHQFMIGTASTRDCNHKVVGNVTSELVPGLCYRFYGYTKEDSQWGPQFVFSSVTEEVMNDRTSVIAYLSTCNDPQKGSITPRIAEVLADALKGDAIETLVRDPQAAFDAVRAVTTRTQWTLEKAELASQYLRTKESTRRGKIELLGLLNGRGFRKNLPDRLLKCDCLGTDAAKTIRANAFILLEIKGAGGFKLVDKLYCDLARESTKTNEEYQAALAAPYRQAACATYSVQIDRSGSTWVPYVSAASYVRCNVPAGLADADAAIRFAVERGALALSPDKQWVALGYRAADERAIARVINDMLSTPAKRLAWPDVDALDLGEDGDHQRHALRLATQKRIGILRGSPGTGKTFCVGRLVKQIIVENGAAAVAVACPTGKAAVRATSALADNGLAIAATTIHRLLVVEMSLDGSWTFFYNASNPMPYRFIVIDEPSMLDVGLMASLLSACSEDCHVIMTGDAEQLAPVGHGKPFFDLQSVVPVGSLTQIRRNSGRIVRACAEIRDSRRFVPSGDYDEESGENLPWVEVGEDEQQDRVTDLVEQMQDHAEMIDAEFDPLWDLQVVTAINDGSPVARKVLNPILQEMFNPEGERIDRNPFRVGDKVICLSNGEYWLTPDFMAWLSVNKLRSELFADESQIFYLPGGQALRVTGPNNEVYVANGELAEVLVLEPKRMIVRLFDPHREVSVPWKPEDEPDQYGDSNDESESKGLVGDWDLGYVISGHKSQGSQWPYVIVAVDPCNRARQVQSRNWVYTVISRAQKATFCVGPLQVALDACQRDGLAGRKTRLVELCRGDRRIEDGRMSAGDIARAELVAQLRAAVTMKHVSDKGRRM